MSSRPHFKTPSFELHRELIVVLLVMASIIFLLARQAQAEESVPQPTPKHKAQRHTTTVIDQDDEVDVPATGGVDSAGNPVVNPEIQREKTMTAKFGSQAQSGMAGCKTEDTAQKTIRELKGDCTAWLKDRKSELKGKYLTGSCDDSCDDCGMNLQRCHVTGTVHYTIGTVK